MRWLSPLFLAGSLALTSPAVASEGAKTGLIVSASTVGGAAVVGAGGAAVGAAVYAANGGLSLAVASGAIYGGLIGGGVGLPLGAHFGARKTGLKTGPILLTMGVTAAVGTGITVLVAQEAPTSALGFTTATVVAVPITAGVSAGHQWEKQQKAAGVVVTPVIGPDFRGAVARARF